MKCVKKTKLVCTYYDKCTNAANCQNVPKGIRENLQKEEREEYLKKGKMVIV